MALLADRDKMRWLGLLWFVFSWAQQRRPNAEIRQLYARAMESVTNVNLRQEIQAMTQSLTETWGEWAKRHYTAEGELRARREDLRMLLEKRFGPLPETFGQRITATEDPERLKACLAQALDIAALEELNL